MNKSFGLGVAIALAAFSATGAQVVGGTPSFTAVRAQIERAGCDIEWNSSCFVEASSGTALEEAGSEARAYSQVRAAFGVNGAYALVSLAQDREAYAESIWSDAFVVHGGTGQSTAQITVRVEGILDGLGQPGGPGSNSFYTLFVSDAPISCDFDALDCTGQAAIPLTEALSGVRHLSASIAFTYDKPFYLASYLGAEVVGGQVGEADFFNSAHFGISAPTGAAFSTGSGTVYQSASSVPEPQSFLMFAVGVLLVWRAGAKRARQKTRFLLATMVAMHCLPSWADTYSFAAVKDAGVSASDVLHAQYGYTDSAFLSDTSMAAASGEGNAARAQTLPGVNRIEVANTVFVTDELIRQTGIGGPFAIALSAWTDNFLITGGTGSGTVRISANVTGQFGQGYGSGGGYGMWLSTPDELQTEVTQFLSTDPTAWLLDTIDDPEDGGETLILSYLANVLKPGYTDPGLSLPPGSQFGGVFTTEVPFTYGESFSIASVLFGFANDTGSLSAMNSAHFGISVLNNADASVVTGSGTVYAAAVPEAQTHAMLLAGLVVLACSMRLKPARRRP